MKVQYAKRATKDLEKAVAYLVEKDNPAAAGQLIKDVIRLAERLAAGEFEGPEEQLRSGLVVRSWPLRPYRLYYRRRKDHLQVMRVCHQARRPITKG